MPKPQRYTPQQVAEALLDNAAVVADAAAELGCTPRTVYNYCKRYPAVYDALEEARKDKYARVERSLLSIAEDHGHKDQLRAIERVIRLYSKKVNDGNDWHDEDGALGAGVTVTVNYPSDIPDPD